MELALLASLAVSSFQGVPQEGLSKGQAFPDFLLPNVDGGFGRLSDYRGKKVLVINFASW